MLNELIRHYVAGVVDRSHPVIGDLVASMVGGALAGLGQGWSERRRNEKAWADGRDVVFAGWVLGERSYCHEPGGALVATASSLGWQSHPEWHAGRQALPVERLRVLRVRDRSRGDDKKMPLNWAVAECADGLDRILIACSRDNIRYVLSVLNRERAQVPLPSELIRHYARVPIDVRLLDERGHPQRGLSDPAGGTFDAAGDFDRLLGLRADLRVQSTVDPYADTRVSCSDATDLLAEFDDLDDAANDGAERRGLARLRVMAERCRDDERLALLFVGD